MRRVPFATALLAAAVTLTAHADVFRVVDDKGVVQYTDRWVPGAELIKTDRTRTRSDSTTPSDSQRALSAGNERVATQQAEQGATKAVQQDVAAMRAQQCKAAKERYDKLIEGRRIYRAGKDGEREFLTDEQADKERVQARLDMQQVCGASVAAK